MSTPNATPSAAGPGAWSEDTGLLLFGLCPLLAVTTSLVNGLGLGVATAFVLLVSNAAVSALRPVLVERMRLMIYVVVIAATVSVVERFMASQFFRLYLELGLFVPLIASNCLLIARAELVASRSSLAPSVADALRTGAGFTLALTTVGALRELFGTGTLLRNAEFLFGATATDWTVHLGDGFLLMALPPGAFIMVALVIAALRAIRARR